PNPFPPRWGIAHAFSVTRLEGRTRTLRSICLSLYQWSRVTSPDLHRAVREIEGGCDATVLCNQRGLARPSAPSSARKKGVDARIKSAQDDLGLLPRVPQVILLGKFLRTAPALRER